MKAQIKWLQDVEFLGTAGSGHEVTMDGPPEFGGKNAGLRPMEMLLLGLGGCSAFDVVHILKKSRQQVSGCEIEIHAERAETEPKVFTRINLHYVVSGADLKPNLVDRAIKLSAEKYCSASIMLAKSVDICHDYEIREE
jgi:putative redox protein